MTLAQDRARTGRVGNARSPAGRRARSVGPHARGRGAKRAVEPPGGKVANCGIRPRRLRETLKNKGKSQAVSLTTVFPESLLPTQMLFEERVFGFGVPTTLKKLAGVRDGSKEWCGKAHVEE